MENPIKTGLEGYLAKSVNSSTVLEQIGELDPERLSLCRTNYSLMQGRERPIYGDKITDEKVRQKEKMFLKADFERLRADPKNIALVLSYAESLSNNAYYELAEKALLYALTLDESNPMIYHRLSRLHLDLSHAARRNKKVSARHSQLADQITERGLELIDEIAVRLVEDALDASSHLSNQERYAKLEDKLRTRFSRKYALPNRPAQDNLDIHSTSLRDFLEG